MLQAMDGQHDDPEDDILFRGMQDIHSRPSTAASVLPSYSSSSSAAAPSSVGYGSNDGTGGGGGGSYSYGREPGGGGRKQGIAASSRPSSAEFSRQLMQLNGLDGKDKTVGRLPLAPAVSHLGQGHGYGDRPRSGGRSAASAAARRGAAVVGSRSNNARYSEVHASVDDVDFDNYSDYGL